LLYYFIRILHTLLLLLNISLHSIKLIHYFQILEVEIHIFKQGTDGPHPPLPLLQVRDMKIVCELKFDIEQVEEQHNGLVEQDMEMVDLCMVILRVVEVHLGDLEVEMGNGSHMIRGNLMLKVEQERKGI